MIRSKEIIAILNHDAKDQAITAEFLKEEEKNKPMTVISADYIKSIVLTNKEIYYSPVSSLTLNRRAQGQMDIQMDKDEIDS